ncbi:MAG: hypothetical protein HC915_08820 [Anaerolineae bacterium]|nr:hypothetical protein [Anaerolineae bacterium]
MTNTDTSILLQAGIALALLMGTVLFILAVVAFRRSRRETFWRQRRRAGERGLRYAASSTVLLFLAGFFALPGWPYPRRPPKVRMKPASRHHPRRQPLANARTHANFHIFPST